MPYDTLRVETDARGVARLSLARPEKRNALSALMIAELTEAAQRLGADAAVRAVVLAGEGETFCAGGDLDWMRAQFGASRTERVAEATKLARMLLMLNALPKPLIARVHGGAYGGGVGLMAVADLAVVAEEARLGLTETRLGLVPATICPYVVARIGEGKARRVFMSGRTFSGTEAVALDLAARAVAPQALDEAVEAEVAPYLAAAPGVVARAKALVRAIGSDIGESVIAMTAERLADAWEDPEAAEGVEAFLEKRRPRWAG